MRVDRARAAVAVSLAAVLAAGAAVVLHALAPPGGPQLRFADFVVGVAFPLAGALVLRREPRNAAGRLLVFAAVVAAGPLLNETAWRILRPGSASSGATRTVGEAALWLANWVWTPYLLLPTLLVLLLPGGRLPSARWRPLARAVVGLTAVAAVAAMLRPGGGDQISSLDNPLGIAGASFLTPLMAVAAGLVLGVGGAVCVGGLLVRQRRAAGRERAQLQWLGAGAAAAATSFVGSVAAPWPLGEILLGAGLLALPAAIAVATWRHQLFDVEVVLNRAVVSLALTVAGLALYALVVVGVGDRLAPTAAAAIALLPAGLWRHTQRLIGRLLYGARDDPYSIVERLGARLESASAPAQALQALVETVRDTLRLPYVTVTGADADVGIASSGAAVAGVEEFPCVANGRLVATLAVGRRHRGERWRAEERSLLVETARRAAALVQLGALVRELEHSRNRIVAAREEERRRLRRELHDGVA